MHNDVYRQPNAELIEPDDTRSAVADHYVLPQTKLWAYSLLSFGVFLQPWHYLHWARIKQRDGSDIWPVARAIFAIFFVYPLCKEIQHSNNQNESQYSWPASAYAILYIVFSVVGNGA